MTQIPDESEFGMSAIGFFSLFFIGLFPVLVPATLSTARAINGWRGRRRATAQ